MSFPMRIFAAAILTLTLVPLELDAQLMPRRTRRPQPTDPVALPPQAPTVAKSEAYRRLRVGVESYPLLTVVHAPLFPSGTGESIWADVGAGTHVGYRFSRMALATLDVTTSAWGGGPARTQTIELGARIMPDRYDSRTRPYADVRMGYLSMYNRGFTQAGGDPSSPNVPGYGNSGFSAVVGAGVYRDLTPRFSLSAATSLMRGQLSNAGIGAEQRSFAVTAYRLSLGVRYNPVRQIIAAQPTAP